MSTNLITYEYLRNNYKHIHAFGLGFIQIKLNDKERVHVYAPNLKNTTGPEDVHNHRYDFKSTVLKGYLVNKIYREVPGNDFILTQESCNKKIPSSGVEKTIGLELVSSDKIISGRFYKMKKDTLHRVETERAITFLVRGPVKKDFAEVVTEVNSAKICPFSVNLSERELWLIVKKEFEDAY